MKSTKTLSTAVLVMALFGDGNVAAADRLHGFEIRRAFSGITLDGIYRNGTFFSETYSEDGTIRYHDVNGADAGRWEVRLDTFCTTYEHQQGACFYVRSDGDNCFSFYEAVTGKSPREIPLDDWSSRGWNRDRPATCPKAPQVEI